MCGDVRVWRLGIYGCESTPLCPGEWDGDNYVMLSPLVKDPYLDKDHMILTFGLGVANTFHY